MPADTPFKVSLYSPASRGGAGWFLSELAQSIADAGADLLLVSPPFLPETREPRGTRRLKLVRGTAGRGSVAVRAARNLQRIFSTFPALFRARRHSREIVVTLYDWVPVLVAQMLWIKLIGGRLTFIVHDATPHAWSFPAKLRWAERALFRLSYRLPDRIVSLTRPLHDELAEHYGRTNRSWVIPHGAYADHQPGPLPGNNVVLVFGMLRRNKNILETIEAVALVAAELPNLRLVIAGEPHAEERDYWRACEAALAKGGAAIRTEIGFVAETRVAELLAECDALVLPYQQFNSQSGVAVLAAFAERLTIATQVGGIAELAALGLQPVPIEQPVTAESIAAALRRFAAIPVDERRTRAAAARAALEAALSWQHIGRSYLDLLKSG